MPTSTSVRRAIGEDFPRAFVVSSAGLLSLLDFTALLFAGWLTANWLRVFGTAPADEIGWSVRYLLVLTALLAAIVLYDKQFGARARRADWSALVRCYLTRFALLVAAVAVIGSASGVVGTTPPGSVATWLAFSFVLALLARVVLAKGVRRLMRKGVLTEMVAIVGAGSLADRLKQDLSNRKRVSMHLVGVFDDDGAAEQGGAAVTGTIDDLLEFGKTRHLDWIFLNLPCADEQRLAAVVSRLKALSVPVALCPWNVGLGTPYQVIDFVGGALPVTVLVDRPARRWRERVQSICQFLPRWVTTLLLLPLSLASLEWPRLRSMRDAVAGERRKLVCELDDYDGESFVCVATEFGQSRYGFVVTPNVDHLIRLHDDAQFRALYAAARYVLLDSRFLANVLRLFTGRRLPVCTGSDLTARLFTEVVAADDRIVVVGGNEPQMRELEARFGLRNLVQFSPPMGFIRDPKAVEACLSFVEAHSPFRFCLLAVGSPQQEILAERLQTRGVARGLALCVGASIDFVTGAQRRAPQWLQRVGLEWVFRLGQSPARLAKRYLVRGPRILGLLRKSAFVLRTPSRALARRGDEAVAA